MTRLFQPPKHLSFLATTKQEEPIQLVLVVESEILKSISITTFLNILTANSFDN